MKQQRPEVIFEDEAIIIVNKPANYLAIPDRYAPEKPNLYGFLNNKYGKVFIVHRIDKETSGILCFAKTESAHKNLSQQFEDRSIGKYYFVLVEGQMHQTEGTIEKPIAPSPFKAGKMIIAKKGKASLTLYKTIEEFKQYTLVEANIKTGRTHQIRVHFNSIGYPLAIDSVYGRQSEFLLSSVKHKKYKSGIDHIEIPLMSRTSLHAYRLELVHPASGKMMEFTAPLPKDFKAVLQQLRKWTS